MPDPRLQGPGLIALPRETIQHGLISRLQLETVVYAAFRHSIMLKDEHGVDFQRSGILLGDGPGIGKGRQIAGRGASGSNGRGAVYGPFWVIAAIWRFPSPNPRLACMHHRHAIDPVSARQRCSAF